MVILIIIITCIVSILCFQNQQLLSKFQFSPWLVFHKRQFYRMISYGFVHSDWAHLFVNMFVLYSFGNVVYSMSEYYFESAQMFLLLLYFGGIIFSCIYSLIKHRDNYYYAAVGASGAVSSVLFCSIVFQPTGMIQFLFLPFSIPAFIFGVFYLAYSAYMSRRSQDNIGHDAHFFGAVYGIILPIIVKPELIGLMISFL